MGTGERVDVSLNFFRGTLRNFAKPEGSTLAVGEEA